MNVNTLFASPSPVFHRSYSQEEHAEFSNKFDTAEELSEEIKAAARCNNAQTMDFLFTKACDDSAQGRAAARFLLALYSGKEGVSRELMEQLGRDSLNLVEIVFTRNNKNPLDKPWKIPPEILVMAGFEAEGASQVYKNIVAGIKSQPMFCASIEGDAIDDSLFGLNRMITSVELDAVSAQLNSAEQSIQFCEARQANPQACAAGTIDQPVLNALLLDDRVSAAVMPERFIPLLMDNHWVLFGLTFNETGEKSAVVFSSLESVGQHQLNYLHALASVFDVPETNVTLIKRNLQEYAPNACGLFVAQAMEIIATSRQNQAKPAASALLDFVEFYQELGVDKQILFNRHGRAGMFGAVVERLSSQTPD